MFFGSDSLIYSNKKLPKHSWSSSRDTSFRCKNSDSARVLSCTTFVPFNPAFGTPAGGQQEVATRGGGCRRHHLRADWLSRELCQVDAVMWRTVSGREKENIPRSNPRRRFSGQFSPHRLVWRVSLCIFISSLFRRVNGHGHSPPPFSSTAALSFFYSEFKRSRFSNRVFLLSCMTSLCVYSSLSLSFSLFHLVFYLSIVLRCCRAFAILFEERRAS